MTSKTDAIKQKLQKILAIVCSNGNEHERDMAMLRLQEMLVKHRLEMSDIEEKEQEGIVKVSLQGINGPWARSVAQSIANLNFCNYHFQRRHGNDQRFVTHVFVGRPHEVEVAKELSMLILEQLVTEARTQARQQSNPAFERSFLNGAANTIYWRCKELIKAAGTAKAEDGAASKSTALAVVNAYALATEQNKQYLAKIGVEVTVSKTRTATKSYAGAAQGAEFGKKIPLHLSKRLAG